MTISLIRLIGIVLAVVILLVVFLRLRNYRSDRFLLSMMAGGGILLLLVALFPSIATLPARLLSLHALPAGRLVALLLIVSGFFWGGLWLLYLRQNDLKNQLSQILQSGRRKALKRALEGYGEKINEEPVVVVIPALNEEEGIKGVLLKTPKEVMGHPVRVLVVDDGSTDNTAKCAKSLGACVISLPVTSGGGNALRIGFQGALAMGAICLVTMDGDGQHDPMEMEELVSGVLKSKSDIVIGSRLLGSHEHTSLARSLGVHIFNFLISFIIGKKITDCASGYRAISAKTIPQLKLVQDQYHTAELIIEASKHDLAISQVPITISRREYGVSKKGGSLLYGFFFFRTVILTWMR